MLKVERRIDTADQLARFDRQKWSLARQPFIVRLPAAVQREEDAQAALQIPCQPTGERQASVASYQWPDVHDRRWPPRRRSPCRRRLSDEALAQRIRIVL